MKTRQTVGKYNVPQWRAKLATKSVRRENEALHHKLNIQDAKPATMGVFVLMILAFIAGYLVGRV